MTIENEIFFGLLGINGAGKSTLIKMMAGIMRPDSGDIFYDGESLFKNTLIKQKIFYLPDDFFFFQDATIESMETLYKSVYGQFDIDYYNALSEELGFNKCDKIRMFSKGMKRQVAILLAISSGASYILCDEIFDGLDVVIRGRIQSLLRDTINRKKTTVIVASHDLNELESIADSIGIIHAGGILLSREIKNIEFNVHKYHCIFKNKRNISLENELNILYVKQDGSLLTILVQGKEEEIESIINREEPIFFEKRPLSIEEIFRYEGERIGYDISEIV
ncbi:MAG: ABC transporter ATP-binding protein [Candidatus Ruminococcus intestinipullorum]|nr:ABC transporter ATP-binding protein [Candidatus Ruminococcus intestinipullorum]